MIIENPKNRLAEIRINRSRRHDRTDASYIASSEPKRLRIGREMMTRINTKESTENHRSFGLHTLDNSIGFPINTKNIKGTIA